MEKDFLQTTGSGYTKESSSCQAAEVLRRRKDVDDLGHVERMGHES